MPKYNIDIGFELDDFDAEDYQDAKRKIDDYIKDLAKIAAPLNFGEIKWSAITTTIIYETENY